MIIYNISSFEMFATLFIMFNAIVMQQTDAHRVTHFASSPHVLPDTAVFDDSIKCMTATTYYVLSLLSIVPISLFVSFLVTSQLYRRNLLAIIGARFRPTESFDEEESEPESEPEPTPEEKYISLYPIKRASNDPPRCLDELKYSIIVEGTPRGILVMCYNIDTEGFEYWSDSDIPLTMLETAARRYVMEYNCKSFYLPRKKVNAIDKDDEEQPPVNVEEHIEDQPSEEEDSVFIKRKKTDAQVKLDKQIAEEEPVTRFIKRGKLLDFKPKDLFKGMNFEEQMVKTKLDYSTFQKAMMESMAAEADPRTSRHDYAAIRDAIDAKKF